MKNSVFRLVIEGNEDGYYWASVSYPFREMGFRMIASCGGAKAENLIQWISPYVGNASLLDRAVAIAKHEREKNNAKGE